MDRFPGKKEVLTCFLTVNSVVNFWGVSVFLYNIPGLIKQMTFVDIFFLLSYVLTSALFGSLVVTLVLVLLGVLLPAKFLRTDFLVRSAIILLLMTIFIIPFHVNNPPLSALIFDTSMILMLSFWFLFIIAAIILISMSISKYPQFHKRIKGIIDRIVVLGRFFLFFDLAGPIAVIGAN